MVMVVMMVMTVMMVMLVMMVMMAVVVVMMIIMRLTTTTAALVKVMATVTVKVSVKASRLLGGAAAECFLGPTLLCFVVYVVYVFSGR